MTAPPDIGGAPAVAGLVPLFIEVAPADIAILKFLFESYEGVAVVRTLDRHEAVIVALVSADFLHVARGMLDSLADSIAFREISAPAAANQDWLLQVLWGLDSPAAPAVDASAEEGNRRQPAPPSSGSTRQRS